ncbi:MAG: 23S rRNA (guanosine(2251)-2'-O)-methyltransferase RlmB [Bacilli bacterium]
MYVHGKNVVKELLNSDKKIHKAYVLKDFNDKDLIIALENKNIVINYVDKNELDQLERGNHQGIIVSIPDFEYTSLEQLLENRKERSIYVMLDHLEDPHNFGAIIRTCEAAGVDGIIIPKDRSVEVNSTVMKVSSGAASHAPICMVTNLNATIKVLKKKDIWVIGTDMYDSVDYRTIDYNIPICLVIGGEGKGMSRLVNESCDIIVRIPMEGKVNSLNASVAAGIMIYEIKRNRG